MPHTPHSTCAISVIRVKFLKQGGDQTYENIEGSSWSITELCSGVICACLPTLRPLVSKCAPALSRRLHKSSRGYQIYSDTALSQVENHTKLTRSSSSGTHCQRAVAGSTSPFYQAMPISQPRPSSSRRGTAGGIYKLEILPSRGPRARRFSRASSVQEICLQVDSQVTTEIGLSHSPPPNNKHKGQDAGIHVKHVVVVSRGD